MTSPGDRDDAGRRRPVVPAWRWWGGLFFVGAVAFGLTALAYVEGLPLFLIQGRTDKVLHFTFAGLLAFFLDGALRRRGIGPGGRIPLAAVLVLVPAGIEEYLQRYATFRTASLGDFAADVAGVIFFLWLSRRAAA
jgi:VanZ family protein